MQKLINLNYLVKNELQQKIEQAQKFYLDIQKKHKYFYQSKQRFEIFNKQNKENVNWYFITLTFGKQKNEYGDAKKYEDYNVKSITNIISKSHKFFSFYLQVRELGGENKRQHYHLLVASKYSKQTLEKYLNRIWYFGRKQVKEINNLNIERLSNYLTKYMTSKEKVGRICSSIPLPKKYTIKDLETLLLQNEFYLKLLELDFLKNNIDKESYLIQKSKLEEEKEQILNARTQKYKYLIKYNLSITQLRNIEGFKESIYYALYDLEMRKKEDFTTNIAYSYEDIKRKEMKRKWN